MGGGEIGPGIAVDVERILDHVVPHGTDHVEEELAGEGRECEAPAHLAAVDDDRAGPGRQLLAPVRYLPAVLIEEREPERHLGSAIARPVVGADEARVQAAAVAEEGEIRREIERVEIAPPAPQHLGRQLHLVEAFDRDPRGKKRAQIIDEPGRIEGDHEQALGTRGGKLGHRLAAAPEPERAHLLDFLHEDAGKLEPGQGMECS